MISCDDVDRLRTASAYSNSAGWPPEVKAHLDSCDRCAQLQAAMDGAKSSDLPEALQHRIETGILGDLRPVVPLPGVGRVIILLLLAAGLVTAIANWYWGTEGWDARSALQAAISFVLLGSSMLVLANALAQAMSPGARRSAGLWIYLAFPVLALLAANWAMFGYHANPRFIPQALWCWEIGVTCAALSAPLFWFVLRRGFSLTPISRGAMTGLLAGLVGVTVLEIYCPQLDPLHISVAHIGAAITAALVGAAVGYAEDRIGRSIA